jgi:hypothetical protein
MLRTNRPPDSIRPTGEWSPCLRLAGTICLATWWATTVTACDAGGLRLGGDGDLIPPDATIDEATDPGVDAIADEVERDLGPYGCPASATVTPCHPVGALREDVWTPGRPVAAAFGVVENMLGVLIDGTGYCLFGPCTFGLTYVLVDPRSSALDPITLSPIPPEAAVWTGSEFGVVAQSDVRDHSTFSRIAGDGDALWAGDVPLRYASHSWLFWTGESYLQVDWSYAMQTIGLDGSVGEPTDWLLRSLGSDTGLARTDVTWGPAGLGVVMVIEPAMVGMDGPPFARMTVLDPTGGTVAGPIVIDLGPNPLGFPPSVVLAPAPFGFVLVAFVTVGREEYRHYSERVAVWREEVRALMLSPSGETLAGPFVLDRTDAVGHASDPCPEGRAQVAVSSGEALLGYLREETVIDRSLDPPESRTTYTRRLRAMTIDGVVGEPTNLPDGFALGVLVRSGPAVAVAGYEWWEEDGPPRVRVWSGCCE